MTRTYDELNTLQTFKERYEYLALTGSVGEETFGVERYLNQRFYRSPEWKRVRSLCIARDLGCDLGTPGYEIHYRPIIHHMNPIKPKDLLSGNVDILNPNYLITTSHDTHNAIHYGDPNKLFDPIAPRELGDTQLW